MSKDDYFVIVYKILRHLYDCLKTGKEINWNELKPGTRRFPVSEDYWEYIWRHLEEDGYVEGMRFLFVTSDHTTEDQAPYLAITPKGIEYLQENRMMKKMVRVLQVTKDLIPFA